MADLCIKALKKSYGPKTVVKDVDLVIADGSFTAMLGPSGSGKTTILQMIAGLATPDAGRILVGGKDITRALPEKRNIGVVFQSYALFPHLSVAENVAYGLRARRARRAERDRKVAQVLELVGLSNFYDRKPDQLSGGQRQRVAIARALVVEPDLLLLDEPLSALDRKIRGDMQTELARIHRETGLTTVMVTHDQEEALDLADQVVLLDDGKVQQVAGPTVMYRSPRSSFVADFMGNQQFLDVEIDHGPDGRIVRLPGMEIDVAAERAQGIDERADLAIAAEAVRLRPWTPEDGTRNCGTVARLRFFGPTAEAEVELGATKLRALMLSTDADRLEPGAKVAVSISAEGTHLFSRPAPVGK